MLEKANRFVEWRTASLQVRTHKTPIFQKRENPMKCDVASSNSSINNPNFKKKRGKNMEINDGDWEALRTFQATKIEERDGINGEIDNIRSELNKITDKNYNEKYTLSTKSLYNYLLISNNEINIQI